MPLKVSTAQFVDAWHRHGSPSAVAVETGLDITSVHKRRARLAKTGIRLETRSEGASQEWGATGWTFDRERQVSIPNGTVVVSSDHHYWPGEPSVAHRALIEVIKAVKPVAKIVNGDIFDGVSICRHPPFGWSKRPSVTQELHACQERLGDIEQALPNGALRLWNIGNHDIRFERKLCSEASEFVGSGSV